MKSVFGQRILVLVPHPDDEVVACAATIGHARHMGSRIFSLYLTTGCIALNTLWPWQRKGYSQNILRRRQEAQQVAKLLGIVPTAWSSRPARQLWRQLPRVVQEVSSIVARHQIDQLWVPAYEGGNADHDGLNAVGALFSSSMSVLEFAEYNWMGGVVNSQTFPYPSADVRTIFLNPGEQSLKRHALKYYASEKRNLSYVNVVRESFRPIAAYDYSKPPHPGVLWYTRFQWVPFRHPSVDFTEPSMVCEAIRCLLHGEG
ncbi:MAG: PIG-L family deacetylase [Alphaproteobacteria bacterium]